MEGKINRKSSLHYGAYVIISHSFDERKERFLYSDGFIVKRLIMKEFTDETEEDVFGSVFRILPPFKHDSHGVLR